MLHIGFVGCGEIARHHARYAAQSPLARVTACHDVNAAAAAAFASQCGGDVRVCASLGELLEHSPLDAVMVCTPTSFHADPAVAALRAGKHVFCEKPLARTLEQCDEILAAAERSHAGLTVGFVRRFDHEWKAIDHVLKSGRLGRPVIWRQMQASSRPAAAWLTRDEIGGGPFLDAAIHNFDFALQSFGPVRRVMGVGDLWDAPQNSGVDTGSLIVEHVSGDSAVISWTWGMRADGRSGRYMDLIGPRGGLSLSVPSELVPADKPREKFGAVMVTAEGRNEVLTYPRNDMFADQMTAWLTGLASGRAPGVTGQDGRAALRVALAALDALRGRRVVEL